MRTYKVSDLFKTSWAELTAADMIKVIEISDQVSIIPVGSKEYGFAVISMLQLLQKNNVVSKIELEQAVDCFHDIQFFRRDSKGAFKTPWHFFPIGNFWVDRIEFTRPEMNGTLPMYNRCFDQLVYADSAFSSFCFLNYQYRQAPSKDLAREMDESINGLIAALYVNPHDFDPAMLQVNSDLVSLKLNLSSRALILHTYANVRSFLVERCPNLFPRPEEDEYDALVPESAPELTGPMWLNLRYDLAETEVFKGLETARKALIYDALDYLDKKALEALKNKPNQNA